MNTPTRPKRRFVAEDPTFDWEHLEPYYKDLQNRPLESAEDLENWMLDRNELEAVLEEEGAWRYIRSNIDTRDADLKKAYEFWVEEIVPKLSPYDHALNEKFVASPFTPGLDQEKYFTYIRSVKRQIEIYREENIPLFTEISKLEQQYGAIAGAMSVTLDDEEMTLQKASLRLKDTDRAVRKEAYEAISARRLQDRQALDDLFDKLIDLRQRVAKNASFENFRDYMFAAKGRFDYTPEDCFAFHDAIAKHVVPALNQFEQERKQKLGLDTYRPYDTSVDELGRAPLKPFDGGDALLEKSIACFRELRPFYGECLSTMKAMGHLDLESKTGKAPGGFNYPLYEIGVPFIYMNAVGSHRDVETLMHEGGHAIHAFLAHALALNEHKSTPAEVAELASMSMELLSMDTWHHFYDEKDHDRARQEQLKESLGALPWIATIDKFQHWIYTTEHTQEERRDYWNQLMDEFGNGAVNWEGYEDARSYRWQQQLHLYEVPFYYIEYGMAQLGAIAMRRQYVQKGPEALDNYEAALKLGYTKTIPDLYKAAGISFSFTADYVRELVDFVQDALNQLKTA